MRILLLVPQLNSGGVETGTIDLAKSLQKIGEAVIVVSSGGVLVQELSSSGIRHIRLPIERKSFAAIMQISALSRIIREEKIDIVHAQSRVPAWIAYYACKMTHTPFVTSCHGYYSRHFFSSIMGRGKKVIVISRAIGQHMQEAFGVPPKKICLIYRGVDISRYPYIADKYDHAHKISTIVNIGRLSPIKGQYEFIKAVNIVAQRYPQIRAKLVGSTQKPHYEARLRCLVKELGLENIVSFLGQRSDIYEIIKEADLLVLSTKTPEAFGRVLIEAGATGTAVCAPRIGGITEIIDDTRDGLLFTAGDVDAMAQAMMQMIENSSLCKEYSRNLRRKVEAEFSLELMVSATHEVYKEATRKNIIIIKLGGLGDVILSVPSLRALRKRFVHAKIAIVMYRDFEPLFKRCPYIDEIIPIDRKKSAFLQLLPVLRENKFDIAIDFKNSDMTHLVCYLAGIPKRYGFAKGFFKFLVRYPYPQSTSQSQEPIQQQLDILKLVGISALDDSLQLWSDLHDDSAIDIALKEKGVSHSDTLIGFVLRASAAWPTKNWPLENFVALSQKLIKQGYKIVLIAEASAKKDVEAFGFDKRIISFVAETSISQLVSLISRLHLIVTPDSAPMHIAAACNKKIIALFGPTEPLRHAPPAKSIEIFVHKIPCQPCYSRKCKNSVNAECLRRISVDQIIPAIERMLS